MGPIPSYPFHSLLGRLFIVLHPASPPNRFILCLVVFCVCDAGPDFWGLVNPKWRICNKGKLQSPINIDPKRLLFDPNLTNIRMDKQWVSSPFSSCCKRSFYKETYL